MINISNLKVGDKLRCTESFNLLGYIYAVKGEIYEVRDTEEGVCCPLLIRGEFNRVELGVCCIYTKDLAHFELVEPCSLSEQVPVNRKVHLFERR